MTDHSLQAVLELPPLSPEQALLLVDILERCRGAIWEAHGQQMAELLLDRYTDRPSSDLHLPDDADLPF